MRVYIQIKQLGKRKYSIEKIPIDFPVRLSMYEVDRNHRQLAKSANTMSSLQQSEVLKYLTQEEVENKTASGKVGLR